MPDPNRFFISDAKIDPGDLPLPAPFQLTKPLVRDVEVPHDGHGKDATDSGFVFSQPRNAVTKNHLYHFVWRKMHEHRHGLSAYA